jgi:micrococcal nuclease
MPLPTFCFSLRLCRLPGRWWLIGAWLAGGLWPGAMAQAAPEVYEARVSRVSDGDTLWVKPLAGGPYRKLRLEGLDAPEICQPGGVEAREALAARVLGQVVTVRVRAFDDYGRAVARVEHGSVDVGGRLVREGHAWSSRWRGRPTVYAPQEALARAQRRGVFQAPDAEEPRAFRRRHGPCPMPPRSARSASGR